MIVLPLAVTSQVGGASSFQLLELSSNARSAALGGRTISLAGDDISQFFSNPASADSARRGDIFFNLNPFFTDIFVFNGAYGFNVKDLDGFVFGLTYAGYGSFDETDPTGIELGNFDANDYMLSIGKSHQLGPITLGASLKYLNTTIDTYGASAFLSDIGGVFRVTENWTLGMSFNNIGFIVRRSVGFESFEVPIGVYLGTSFKPAYMPFRFTLTSNNLVDENFIEEIESEGRSNRGVEQILRRIGIGAELLLSDNFQLLVGYNHKRKQELKLEEISGGAGFSYGLMANIKGIELRFSRATFHAAGGSSFISIRTNFREFNSIL